MIAVKDFLLSLPKVTNHQESFEVFKQIYYNETIDYWLDMDKLLNYSNGISLYRPDLISCGIRLNVQVNLFLKTIQKFEPSKLDLVGNSIGCFGLTESNAGVLSGLIVETEYSYNQNDQICLHKTPNGIFKNWISQGMFAEYVTLFARNKTKKSQISVFLLKFDDFTDKISRQFKIGPVICDTLDVAEIRIIEDIHISKSCILEGTKHVNKKDLLNGIYHGRWMIAEAILHSILGMLNYCQDIVIQKPNLVKFGVFLSNYQFDISKYISQMKRSRDKCGDINVVNSFKVDTIAKALEIYFHTSKVFGSYILNYPLKYEDILLNKIAEGDTDVLRYSLIHNEFKKGVLNNLFGPLGIITVIGWFNPDYIKNNYIEISNTIIKRNLSKL